MSRSRNICFTLFFDDATPEHTVAQASTPEESERICHVLSTQLGGAYCCGQFEITPTTGRLHYQGYIRTRDPKSFRQCMAAANIAARVNGSWRKANGNDQQNRAYCSKPESSVAGTFAECGTPAEPGRRTDLEALAASIREGTSLTDLAASNPTEFIRHYRGLQEFSAVVNCKPRDASQPVTVYWWFGPTGSGKSKRAFEQFPAAYVKMTGNKWWDGYMGQKEVLIDDHRPADFAFSYLLKMLDRYPMMIERKGSSCHLSGTTFVITTTSRPEILWNGKTDELLNQLIRRITFIEEFKADGTTIVHKQPGMDYEMVDHPNPFINTFNA